MKWVFLVIAVTLLGLYLGAVFSLPKDPDDGIMRLRWATDDNPARPEQTAGFAEMFPDALVQVDPGLGSDQTKLIVQCATGTGPDLIDVYDLQMMDGLVRAGILLDLTPYAKEMGFDPPGTYPSLRNALMVDGKQYRFPCNVWANAIVYNREVFDDHGVPYPDGSWTWDDFIEIGQRFRTPGRSGKTHIPLSSFKNDWMYGDMLVSHGGRRFDDNGLVCLLDSDEAIAAAELYWDMIHKDRLIPSPAEAAAYATQGGWGLGPIHWFSSERAAMIPIGRWYLIQHRDYPKIMAKIGAARFPHVPGRPSTGLVGTRAAGVNAKSPHREQALQFLRYLASEKYGRLIASGGDGLPPSFQFAESGELLVNDAMPRPEFHQVFIDAALAGSPLDLSPFIDAAVLQRWLVEALEKIETDENRKTTPAAYMQTLAREVNLAIRRDLSRRADLRETFARVMGRPWTEDWWKSYTPAISQLAEPQARR